MVLLYLREILLLVEDAATLCSGTTSSNTSNVCFYIIISLAHRSCFVGNAKRSNRPEGVYHAFYHGGIVRSPDEKLSLRFRGIPVIIYEHFRFRF